ncbi:hypothetical protein D5F11_009080 [Siminovitchia terrae]|uniref:Uncharacterized protein n=1 Tax=Siminovitchia terrae TaxID=1914933 RepID=A0A429X9W6_SIMTE|nr:hypothetical protein [Siminovitchia terrae]RST60200.1 hypothetical protein D5F11_009080 [Siminovitchia terrae]
MSQMKSMLLAMLFFVGFIIPGFLLFFIDSTNQNAFLKTTKEITELVKEDAGVSDRVKSVVNDYKAKGYTISFTNQHGQPVNGIANYGDTIQVHYQYTFKSVFKDQTLESSNKVFILKRNGENRPGWENGGELQPRSVVKLTTESKNATHEETFVIPGMTQLKSVTSNTGSVEVVRVEGNRVTVRATNGSPSKKVQTGGTVMADDTKIVTDSIVKTKASDLPNSKEYSQDGYEGTLTRHGEMKVKQTGGEYIPAQTKEVGNQTSPNYSDSEGFKGTLERYLHSGKYTPEQSKFVTGQTSAHYSDSEGYRGTLSQYVASGSYSPGDTKYFHGNGYGFIGYTKFQVRECGNYKGCLFWSYDGFEEAWLVDYSDELGYEGRLVPIKTYPPNYSGFFNELPRDNYYLGRTIQFPTYGNYYAPGFITKPGYDTRVFRYQGIVTKPAEDTRVYRYGGKVTKPAVDTRTYEYTQEYKGTATKKGLDTRTYDTYYQYRLTFEYE